MIDKDVTSFYTGGALGFDTLAALVVLKLKKAHPSIELILILPCRDQTKGWAKKDVDIYYDILNRADKVIYIADEYSKACMFKRNRTLIESSQYCICYLNKHSGGTAYTVDYASKRGLAIINIAQLSYL